MAGTGNKHRYVLFFPCRFLEEKEFYLLEGTAPVDSGVHESPMLILSEVFVSSPFSRDADFLILLLEGCVRSGGFPLPPPL